MWHTMAKTQRSKVMVTTWPNMVQDTVLRVMTKSDAHCKRGFWSSMCDLGILGQPACRDIQSMLQHRIIPSVNLLLKYCESQLVKQLLWFPFCNKKLNICKKIAWFITLIHWTLNSPKLNFYVHQNIFFLGMCEINTPKVIFFTLFHL